jgi:hypothetical protein
VRRRIVQNKRDPPPTPPAGGGTRGGSLFALACPESTMITFHGRGKEVMNRGGFAAVVLTVFYLCIGQA